MIITADLGLFPLSEDTAIFVMIFRLLFSSIRITSSHDPSVLDVNDAVWKLCNILIMGNQNNGLFKPTRYRF